MPKTVWKEGRESILKVMRPDGEKWDSFAAKVFGLIYEDLLDYYFKKQKSTRPDYPVWRFVGKPFVKRDGADRRIPVDYLVEDITRPGSSPNGNARLVCFEAKSWPGFQKFHTISSKNVESFLNCNKRFLEYIKCKKWYAKLADDETPKRITPDAFGFLVFDYDHDEIDAILRIFKAWDPKLQEIESIVDLLSHVTKVRLSLW